MGRIQNQETHRRLVEIAGSSAEIEPRVVVPEERTDPLGGEPLGAPTEYRDDLPRPFRPRSRHHESPSTRDWTART